MRLEKVHPPRLGNKICIEGKETFSAENCVPEA